MQAESASRLREWASRLGVATEYWDGTGRWHEVGEDTLRVVLAALGEAADPREPAGGDPPWPPVLVTPMGRPCTWQPPADEPSHVMLESGDRRPVPAMLPGDLPVGYHTVIGPSGFTSLVVAPASCYLPPVLNSGGRAWGWAAQAYAVRSETSWGIGDLTDLATLASDEALRSDFILINPLNEPRLPGHPGPYRPSTRLFRDPLYLNVEQIPERAALSGVPSARFDALAAAGRGLTGRSLIDRLAVRGVKDEALRLCFASLDRLPGRRHEFNTWRASHQLVEEFAVFRSLQEICGHDWRSWPPKYQRPNGADIVLFRGQHASEVSYQAWLQWLIEAQLAGIGGTGIGIISDFPVGVAPGGFDAWYFQDQMAAGVTIGAPPDAFAQEGQNWSLAVLAPGKLSSSGYGPFIQSIRAAMADVGGVRIDHVMGLFRLFLIPDGAEAAQGTYVQYPAEDLLGIVALESQRAQTLVVGEDLGNVEPGVRERLAASGVLSSRVIWFERDPWHGGMLRRASNYPRLAMAAVGTHDLPTVAGFFDDFDLQHQRALGLVPDEDFEGAFETNQRFKQELIDLLRSEGLLTETSPDTASVAAALHAFLGRTPAMLVALRLEDVLQMHERPNVPGTTSERRPQNWRLPLPTSLEGMRHDPRIQNVTATLRLLMRGNGGHERS